ncbi:MAG TPA: isochorismate synthase [Dehalococcoidia bacterium]|nr:isochorismate synthase [Dehalococcoidia bacterium]
MTSAHAKSTANALASVAKELFAAREGRSEGLVSVALLLPLLKSLVGTSLEQLRQEASATWERPSDDFHLFALGTAIRLQGAPDEALSAVIPAIRALRRSAVSVGVAQDARPRFFGGARFDPDAPASDPAWEPFGGWQFFLPQMLVALRDDRVSASATAFVRDGDTPQSLASALRYTLERQTALPASPQAVDEPGETTWRRSVSLAVQEIHGDAYQKVVLARRTDLELPGTPGNSTIIGRLASKYSDCFVFSFRAGESTWLGASPELLVSLSDGVVRAVSLAGSRPRGDDSHTDRSLGQELLASQKERSEHAFVVDAIRDILRPLCADLTVPDGPALMKLANIQHLCTPITGFAADGVDVLDFVVRMHPTPAVGGSPREAAMEAVRRLDGIDRGWYAAPIGWLDLTGDGEFAVGLRAGLVSGTTARLYAGAGIVAGSDPEQEFAEVELKFRPLRAALGGG